MEIKEKLKKMWYDLKTEFTISGHYHRIDSTRGTNYQLWDSQSFELADCTADIAAYLIDDNIADITKRASNEYNDFKQGLKPKGYEYEQSITSYTNLIQWVENTNFSTSKNHTFFLNDEMNGGEYPCLSMVQVQVIPNISTLYINFIQRSLDVSLAFICDITFYLYIASQIAKRHKIDFVKFKWDVLKPHVYINNFDKFKKQQVFDTRKGQFLNKRGNKHE